MFITEEEENAMEKCWMKLEKDILFGSPVISEKRRKLNEDNRKFAYIKQGKTEFAAYVDNKTMKAYRIDGYKKTWMEIKHFVFVRWMRPMDV